MSTLIFDIETVGVNFDTLDEKTKENLTAWIKRESESEADYEKSLEVLKNGLGFSPLTGEIVAIGVLDADKEKGVVYFQSPEKDIEDFEEGGIKYKAMGEDEMLAAFWEGAKSYQEFVTFNGRAFDAPFLNIRSAIHQIRPSVDLMSNRYLSSQKFGPRHVDLADQFTYYGAMRKHPSLHLLCRAFGITSPKEGEVTGDQVGQLFFNKEYEKIARYNAGDLFATKTLFEYWNAYLKF